MPALAKTSIRDQNIASMEAARDGARQAAEGTRVVTEATRQAAETAQETISNAMDAASRVLQGSADQVARSFGLSDDRGEDLARQATRNLEAIAECGGVLMRGFQEISREWLSLARHRMQRNLDGLQALAACRTLQDAVAAQTELARDNIREMAENTRQIAETSAKVAQEAVQTLAGSQRRKGSGRLSRGS
jgi:phasin family protein